MLVSDLRGFGWSDAPRGDYAKSTLAADVLALLDAEGLSKVRIIGHDWGGYVAFLVALEHPSRVERLVALDIAPPRPWRPRLPSERVGVGQARGKGSGLARRSAIRAWSWPGSRWSALGPLYGLVYQRDTRIVRLVVVALSLILRLLRKPVRGFVRPVDAIERVVRENGLSPYFSQRVGHVWQVDHRESVRSPVFRVTVAARW